MPINKDTLKEFIAECGKAEILSDHLEGVRDMDSFRLGAHHMFHKMLKWADANACDHERSYITPNTTFSARYRYCPDCGKEISR